MNLASRMKPQHLRLLMEIAEAGKLQTAANKLAMSQPAASRVLSDIEDHVASPLFVRHPKGMKPTAVGEAFVRHARIILGEIRNLETEVADLNQGTGGEILVGAVTGPAVGCLVPAIRTVKARAPKIKVTVAIAPSQQLIQGLDAERHDFIIARLPEKYDSRNYRITPARTEVVSLLVRKDHPMANQNNVQLKDLVHFEWVMQEIGSPIRLAVDNAFGQAEVVTPANITNGSSLLVVLAMMANSNVIAPQTQEVTDLLIGDGIGADLAVIDLVEPITVPPYYIIQNKTQPLQPAAAFLFDEVLLRL